MASDTIQYMATMPLRPGHYRVLAVSSMEQIIGAALSTLAGIVIPMLQLAGGRELTSVMQGVLGASGLTGIALGSALIGRLSDREGYLSWFRLCPALILLASLLAFFFPHRAVTALSLFLIGIGTGGGYALDSDYISEIMPCRWKLFMVGVAKASCSIGFIATAGICWWILADGLQAAQWNRLFLILAVFGLITLLGRLRWRESPRWLMSQGRDSEAQSAARFFLGPDVAIKPLPPSGKPKDASGPMLKGMNLKRVIFSGVPWACEGVGVYGVGVFLPLLVMALGIDRSDAAGMHKVINSVELTTIINFFILPGFIVGLLAVRKLNHVKMLTGGFIAAAAGLGLLLTAYLLNWPVWISIVAFMIFEIFLNAGPHLVTFIIPSQIYPLADRGTGAGIAAMNGKIGAIIGVFVMPILLDKGGITLVLIVCIAVMALGALISAIFGPQVLPSPQKQTDAPIQ